LLKEEPFTNGFTKDNLLKKKKKKKKDRYSTLVIGYVASAMDKENSNALSL
jgi:hypothetical protein